MDNPVSTTGEALTDGAPWLTALWARVGIAFKSTVNEWLGVFQFICEPTAATAPYEKAALIVEGKQHDPSQYPGVTKDAVAICGIVDIAAQNRTGRAWGGYFQGGADVGSDGLMVGLEVGVNNNGTAESRFDEPTSKCALLMVAGEGDPKTNREVTCASMVSGGNSRFFNGHVVNQNALLDENEGAAFAIRNSRDGAISFKITGDGHIYGMKPRFVNADSLYKIDPPMEPGEELIWGDTVTGTTYRVFFNGRDYLKTAYV